MIVGPETEASNKLPSQLESDSMDVKRLPDVPADPPPLYSRTNEPSAESSTSRLRHGPQVPPNIKPSNFVRLVRPNATVKETWVIDSALHIPTSFLPPLAADELEETRKNLSVESQNGGVDAVVFIVPTPKTVVQKPPNKRTSIHTVSHNGSVTTVVHDIGQNDLQSTRLPLSISTSSANGRIAVYLPRSFHGLVNIQLRNGKLRYSSAVQAMVTPLSDVDQMQRSFVGHFNLPELQKDAEWTGDELIVQAKNGNVRIFFDDELDSPSKPKGAGFFAKLFGM